MLSKDNSDRLGFDRQSMDALRDQISQRIIHKPMPLNVGQTIEATGLDMHGKVRAGTGAAVPRMADVGTAVIGHQTTLWPQGLLQSGFDLVGRDSDTTHLRFPVFEKSSMQNIKSTGVFRRQGALGDSSGLIWRLR
jgi:hypothetical protein